MELTSLSDDDLATLCAEAISECISRGCHRQALEILSADDLDEFSEMAIAVFNEE